MNTFFSMFNIVVATVAVIAVTAGVVIFSDEDFFSNRGMGSFLNESRTGEFPATNSFIKSSNKRCPAGDRLVDSPRILFLQMVAIFESESFTEDNPVNSNNPPNFSTCGVGPNRLDFDKSLFVENIDFWQKLSKQSKIQGLVLVLLICQMCGLRRKMRQFYQERKSKTDSHSDIWADAGAALFALVPVLSCCLNKTGDVKSHDDDEDFRPHKGEKNGWMYVPTPDRRYPREYFCYTIFDRVASFRPLSSSPGSGLVLPLAEAGFKYVDKNFVECHRCRKMIDMKEFNSPATEAKYHREGCAYVKADSLISDEIRERDEDNSTGSSSEVSTDPPCTEPQTFSIQRSTNHLPVLEGGSSTVQAMQQTTEALVTSQNETNLTAASVQQQTSLGSQSLASQAQTGQAQTSQAQTVQAQASQAQTNQGQTVQAQTNQAQTNQGQTGQTQTGQAQTNQTAIGHSEEMGACASPGDSVGCAAAISLEMIDTSQEFEGEVTGVQNQQDCGRTCHKNTGHYTYVPVNQLRLEHIPSNVRHPKVFHLLQTTAKLTVRIEVREISKERPSFLREKTQSKRLYGTGIVVESPRSQETCMNDEPAGKWHSVRKHLLLKKNKNYIYIETIMHVVYDNKEAENTIVEFNYDHPNRKGIIQARGVSIENCNSRFILKCKVSDVEFAESLKKLQTEMTTLMEEIPQKMKERLTKRVFVISHPHGQEKMMSHGEHVTVKYKLKEKMNRNTRFTIEKINNHTQISKNQEEIRKVLFYTADTCEGSSGALVLSFKKKELNDEIVPDLWIHNGVHKSSGLNASVMRELTTEDVANHGKPTNLMPSHHDEDLAPDSSDNPVTSCPVFTVTAPPTHPAYVSCMKRLDSYPQPFNHVHTPQNLADAGFFYAGYADCVRCFQCGLGLRSWKVGDDIYEEHDKNRPDCHFLQMKMRARGTGSTGIQANRNQASGSRNESTQSQQAKLFMSEQQPPATNVCNLDSAAKHGTPQTSLSPTTQMLDHITIPPQQVTVAMASVDDAPSGASADVPKSQAVAVLEREQHYLKQLLICKVCSKNPVKDLFLPCGELIACLECSKLLTHCPSCNKKILATVTTYFS